MLVDSEKVGLLPFDLSLPTEKGSLSDIEYCMNIIVNNGLIGIAPALIYHEINGYSPKIKNPFQITKENEEEVNKSVKIFLKNLDKKYLYGMPSIEIVFLDNGKIADSGTHEKLIKSCELYSNLHLKEKLNNEN